jgi:aryl-alcohol dehydrogenase-like predicted oxidoreductase
LNGRRGIPDLAWLRLILRWINLLHGCLPRAPIYFFVAQMARTDDVTFMEQLEALHGLVREGKVRAIGVCNETPYGLMKFKQVAEGAGLPFVSSLQNAYNLLERNEFETGLLEACFYTNTSLLAHSPLAGGTLTGKYTASGSASSEARLNKYHGFTARYLLPSCNAAVDAYSEVAEKYGLSVAQMSLAWCYTRPFVTSTVLGASSPNQLRENLFALNCPITEEMEEDLCALYLNAHRAPTKGLVSI